MRRGLALGLGVIAVAAGAGPEPARAAWRLASVKATNLLFNQGIAYDAATGSLFFSGVSSQTNSGLYRTDAGLRRTAGRDLAIPRTRERYNHIGDLTFDALRRRLLVPLECYYPRAGGNTCRRGAIGVVDPRTLSFRHIVGLAPSQVAKAMWVETSPDGRWVYASSGTHLLAYPAGAINAGLAARQRAGAAPGLAGHDLGPVLPGSGVSGAATRPLTPRGSHRLFVSLNRGSYFQVISYVIRPGPDGRPAVAGPPTPELSVRRSGRSGEPEGLVITPRRRGAYPLGAPLHWQLVSVSNLTARILNYVGRTDGA